MTTKPPKYFTVENLKVSGIYFLIRKGKIVYIGQTINLLGRLHSYHPCKNYEIIRFISCDKDKMRYYEKRWIIKFRPKYNKMHIWSRRGPFFHQYRVKINTAA